MKNDSGVGSYHRKSVCVPQMQIRKELLLFIGCSLFIATAVACGANKAESALETTSSAKAKDIGRRSTSTVLPPQITPGYPLYTDLETLCIDLDKSGEEHVLAMLRGRISQGDSAAEVACAGWITKAYLDLDRYDDAFRWVNKTGELATKNLGYLPGYYHMYRERCIRPLISKKRAEIIESILNKPEILSRINLDVQQYVTSLMSDIEAGQSASIHELPKQVWSEDGVVETKLSLLDNGNIKIENYSISDFAIQADIHQVKFSEENIIAQGYTVTAHVDFRVRASVVNLANSERLTNAVFKVSRNYTFSGESVSAESLEVGNTYVIFDPMGNWKQPPPLSENAKALKEGLL